MTGFMLHGLGDCTTENHCGCLAGAPDHTAEIAASTVTPDPRIAVVLEWADDQGDDINAVNLLTRLDNLKEYKP